MTAAEWMNRLPRGRVAATLGSAVLLIYATTSTWRGLVSADVHLTALNAWVWAQSGQPWLDGIAIGWSSPNGLPAGQLVQNGEHLASTRTPGVILAAFPLYWLIDAASFALWPAALTAVLLGTATVVLMFLALDSIVRRTTALAATLVFAFATPTWTVSADSLWPQSISQFGIAVAAFAASRGRWVLVGTAFGLAVLARAHVAVIAVVVALTAAILQRRPSIAAKVISPTVLGLMVLAGLNEYRFGSFSISGGYSYAPENLAAVGGSVVWDYLVNLAGFLVSPDRGVLLWSAAALPLVPAAIRAVKTSPSWVPAMALGGLSYTVVQIKINHFSGGDGFYGYRVGLELMTCLLPLFTAAWPLVRSEFARVVTIVLVCLQGAVFATGAISTGLFVGPDDVWRSSSVAVAAARVPALLLCLTLVSMALAVVVVRRQETARESFADGGGPSP